MIIANAKQLAIGYKGKILIKDLISHRTRAKSSAY